MALLGMEFEDTDSAPILLTEGVYYFKRNGFCTVIFTGSNTTTIPSGVWTAISTMPAGYRPTTSVFGMIGLGSSIKYLGVVKIDNSSGVISVFQSTATTNTSGIWGCITYPVA